MRPRRVLCISANPAIDRRLRVGKLSEGGVNRASSAQPLPGGKSAHVAFATKALGLEPVWVGFLGGATGVELQNGLRGLGISVSAIRTESSTRQNLEIIDKEGVITEVLEPGGGIDQEEESRIFSLCRKLFRANRGGVIVISGGLPPGLKPDFYAYLIQEAHRYNCWVILDTSGEALQEALPAAPDLVKPNREEAEWILGERVTDISSAKAAIGSLIRRGARSAAISMGEEGIILNGEAGTRAFFAPSPKVTVQSTVGCGDAAVAGFAFAALKKMRPDSALSFAVACGAANCLAQFPGMISRQHVEELLAQVAVKAV